MAKKPILYYPLERDDGWNWEVRKILPWLYGKTADVGCGGRSIKKTDIRVDLDPGLDPNIVASGDDLPFKNGELDCLYSIHTIEHIEDTEKAIREWLRVVKLKGIVALVVPDRFYTGTKYEHEPKGEQSKFMVHLHEWTEKEFLEELEGLKHLGFEVVDHGIALGNWSFFVVLTKTHEKNTN